MSAPAILVAVLAGGASTRMGRDKALLPWQGATLLAHVCAAVRGAGFPLTVVGRADGVDGVDTLADEHPGDGPLAALATALAAHGGTVLLLACDLPLIDAAAIRWLASHPRGVDGVVLDLGGRLQPCCAVYHASCLRLARACLASGRRSLHALLDAGDFAVVECPPDLSRRFTDVDSREDWDRLSEG